MMDLMRRMCLLLALLSVKIYAEQCTCSKGNVLVCDQNVAKTLAVSCTRKCVIFQLPKIKGSADRGSEETPPCSVREEVMSITRPVHTTDVLYHPCYCIHESQYKPVCSNKFVTFINECAMKCIQPGSVKRQDGGCIAQSKSACGACSRVMRPICASDGKTYSNMCMFQCFQADNHVPDLVVKHGGACRPEDSPYLPETEKKAMTLEKLLLSMIRYD